MTIITSTFLQERSKLIYLLVLACLLTLIITAGFFGPAHAADDDPESSSQNPTQPAECEPPNDWNQTVRLKNPQKPSKQWTFTVSEPEMDVMLVFFYYQDYSKQGCPLDCSTGSCQTDETGTGITPLGNINVIDGKEGGNRGVKKVAGRLSQGTYQVIFTANGDPGSLNIGLNVKMSALPTTTPQPTDTPIPTTTTPTEPPTPTETDPPPTDSPTPAATTPPPPVNPTPTATEKNPQPTETEVTRTPPATLPPPTPLPGSSTPMVLIPVTGARAAGQNQGQGVNLWLFIPLGIGIFGLGIAFYGIANRLKGDN